MKTLWTHIKTAFINAARIALVMSVLMYWLEPIQYAFPHQISRVDVLKCFVWYFAGFAALNLAFEYLPRAWRRWRRR